MEDSKEIDYSKVKLYQLSADWCGPCQMARRVITNKYNEKTIGYEYVDVEEINKNFDEKRPLHLLVAQVKPKSIPHFVIADLSNKELYGEFRGFNMANVTKYVETFKTNNEIEEAEISEEE